MIVTGLIWSGVLLSAIGVMGLATSSRPGPEDTPDDNPGGSPAGSPKPSAGVEHLRAANKVRLIDDSERGFGIARLPNGVYGFTYAPQQESPLFAQKSFHSFEMHKLADGSVHLVGFVTEEEASKLASSEEYFDVDLYPDAWESSAKAVSVPSSRVLEMKGPSRLPGNALTLRCRSGIR
ncbi:MAG TPA: hypothetical protein VE262_11590 [Blastocatellia bacterium]|nr:hypothetical protein [Blastocatellia bacterium]